MRDNQPGNQPNPDWQQAVYSALSDHLTSENARRAADIWQSKYAGGRSSTVVSFMRDLAVEFDLDSRQRHEIRSAIYRAMVYGAQPEQTANFPAPQAREVTECVVLNIVQAGQNAGTQGEMHAELARELGKNKLLASKADLLIHWLRNAGPMPALQENEMIALTHSVYVAACRALGPVAGDKILQKAATRAEALPPASRYPTSRLLYPAKR